MRTALVLTSYLLCVIGEASTTVVPRYYQMDATHWMIVIGYLSDAGDGTRYSYVITNRRQSWPEGRAFCAGLGSGFQTLALHSQQEATMIRDTIYSMYADLPLTHPGWTTDAFAWWLGYRQVNGSALYQWDDGGPADYVSPNATFNSTADGCAVMDIGSDTWRDEECDLEPPDVHAACKLALSYGKLYDNSTHDLLIGFIMSKMNYTQSRDVCEHSEDPPMQLQSVTSEDMASQINMGIEDFLGLQPYLATTPNDYLIWIGLDRLNTGTWSWTDGNPVSYTARLGFDPDDPGLEDCVAWDFTLDTWVDTPCSQALSRICYYATLKIPETTLEPTTGAVTTISGDMTSAASLTVASSPSFLLLMPPTMISINQTTEPSVMATTAYPTTATVLNDNRNVVAMDNNFAFGYFDQLESQSNSSSEIPLASFDDVTSRMECARKCLSNDSCSSFFRRRYTGLCLLFSSREPSTMLPSSDNWEYFVPRR